MVRELSALSLGRMLSQPLVCDNDLHHPAFATASEIGPLADASKKKHANMRYLRPAKLKPIKLSPVVSAVSCHARHVRVTNSSHPGRPSGTRSPLSDPSHWRSRSAPENAWSKADLPCRGSHAVRVDLQILDGTGRSIHPN